MTRVIPELPVKNAKEAEHYFRHHMVLALAFYEASSLKLADRLSKGPIVYLGEINQAVIDLVKTLDDIYERMDQ